MAPHLHLVTSKDARGRLINSDGRARSVSAGPLIIARLICSDQSDLLLARRVDENEKLDVSDFHFEKVKNKE